ncbi:flagellar basal-body rod protein FlgF [Andreprevotia chitinilytica]|uniref:flagellar basal-body rod protein FlgF n=1 Tax=Andreprevotia chitinilytica TaxID=396808 RepID=UPI000554B05F|nr:flagellar basal-body rod protein FlgF [Andreprevotia chitinilytica]
MDRLIYTAMTGARHMMNKQATVAHNLANASTPGFRAELASFRAVPAFGGGTLPTRSFVVQQTTGADLSPGILQATGRDLDVAVNGDGWMTVQTPTGEAYTRNGSFEIDATGLLKTRNGETVMGENGPITIPENSKVIIAPDGTVSATDLANPTQTNQLGRLKLVNPAASELEKGSDGLFRQRNGDPAQPDATVKLAGGMLETSNVNSVDQLVDMVSSQRQYDMQIQMLQNADTNARSAAQLIQFA